VTDTSTDQPEIATPQPALAGDSVWTRLYHGETNVNIVGRWRLWFALSAAIISVGLVSLGLRGVNLGIDFTGGTVWEVPAGDATPGDVERAVVGLGYDNVKVQELTTSTGDGTQRVLRVQAAASASPAAATNDRIDAAAASFDELASATEGDSRSQVENVAAAFSSVSGPFAEEVPDELEALQEELEVTLASLDDADDPTAVVADATEVMGGQVEALIALQVAEREAVSRAVSDELAAQTGSDISEVTVDTVGPSWGKQVSEKARTALVVFLIAIALYITLRFELRMAIATLVALLHDLLVVVGVYSLFQFPVTPATVIAILTILGFSIYDGIVVFDRIDENTKLLGRKTKLGYAEMANLSVNQMLMRSLNTSITAVLPVLAVLVVGSLALGATTLQEFGLALLVGVVAGTYSSIFIATPLLALLKEREPQYRQLRARLDGRGERADEPAEMAPNVPATAVVSGGSAAATVEPRPRKQGRRR
jgi:preprotein translocase subunit SecF